MGIWLREGVGIERVCGSDTIYGALGAVYLMVMRRCDRIELHIQ